jgi:hypothetical protein
VSQERFQRVATLFEEALSLDPSRRAEFLERASAGDAALVREVESLIRAHELPPGVLDTGALPSRPDSPASRLEEGTRLGPWRLGAFLGMGGAGEVYRAERADGAFEQQAAIKLLRREAAAQLERFHAERSIVARLEHPGIARLLDGGIAPDGRPYAVLEYVEGRPLVEHCRVLAAGLQERLALFAQVCDAVSFAHRHLIVHRDLKPGNILVDTEGRVKLLDFGIAKLLDAEAGAADLTTRAPITPDYAAPEQLTGAPITTATDVYALGVILYELLTGQRPWMSSDLPVASALKLLLDTEAPPPSRAAAGAAEPPVPAPQLAGDLDAIVAKCLRKEPASRYPTVEALQRDLSRHLRQEPVQAREGARFYVLRRFLRRHRAALAAVAALILSLAGGLAAAAWQARRAGLERDAARHAASREEAVRYYLTSMFRSSLQPAAGAQPVTAKSMLDRSAERVLREYRDDPELAGKVVETLADLYGALGDIEGQAPLLEAYLAQAGAEADPHAVALARQKLANLELVRGRVPRAAELLAQAEALWTTDPARYREPRLEGLYVRGQLLRAQGDLAGSIATYEEAIRERTAHSGHAHRETANLYNSLAITLTGAGRIEEALAAYREAIAIHEQLGQAGDLDALIMLGNTGTLTYRRGRTREAQEILQAAYEKQRAAAGDSAAVAASMGLSASALTMLDRAPQALPILREAVDMAVRFTGPASPLAVQDRIFLGEALASAGQTAAAREVLRENLAITEKQYGAAHILALRNRLALARLDLAAGDARAAEAAARDLLPGLRALLPAQAAWLAHAQVLHGEALLDLDRAREAIEPLAEARAAREKSLWEGSWELAQARARLGEAQLATGDARGAGLVESARKALRAELGAAHPQAQRAEAVLARYGELSASSR